MASNPTVKKRQREASKLEHQREKAARRAQRKAQQETRGSDAAGEDPDLAGIVPGPQPTTEEG
jgi:hypothetical protein